MKKVILDHSNEAKYPEAFKKLLESTSAPLRYKEKQGAGGEIRYFRERTWGEFLFEKLLASVEERADIKNRARIALQHDVRPHLAAESALLLTRLEQRILGKSAWRLAPKTVSSTLAGDLESTGLMKVGGLARVPDRGLSLSTVPVLDVIADVAIMNIVTPAGFFCQPAHISAVHSAPAMAPAFASACQQGTGRDADPRRAACMTQLENASNGYSKDHGRAPKTFVVDPLCLAGLKDASDLVDEHIGAMLDAIRAFIRVYGVSILIAVPDLLLYQRIETKMTDQPNAMANPRSAMPDKAAIEKEEASEKPGPPAGEGLFEQEKKPGSAGTGQPSIIVPDYGFANDDDNPSFM
jgi:hypothetical protein